MITCKIAILLSFVRSKSACRISARLKLIHYDYWSLRMLPPGHTGLNAICSDQYLMTNDFEFVRYHNAILLSTSTHSKQNVSFHTILMVLLILYEGICHRNCWERSVVIHPSLTQSDFVRPQSVELPLIPPLLRSASPLGTIYHRYWKLGGVYCVISPRSFTHTERATSFSSFFLSHDVLLFLNKSQLAVIVVFSLLCVHFWK